MTEPNPCAKCGSRDLRLESFFGFKARLYCAVCGHFGKTALTPEKVVEGWNYENPKETPCPPTSFTDPQK